MDVNEGDEHSVELLLALTREMVRQAQAAHRALSALTTALEESHKLLLAERRALGLAGRPPAPATAARASAQRAQPTATRPRRGRPPTRESGRLETGRLVALEMMLNGGSPAEVDEMLRETLGLEETARVIEAVYGIDRDGAQ
jgi:hypothetical protein